jgi:hypothetical protein
MKKTGLSENGCFFRKYTFIVGWGTKVLFQIQVFGLKSALYRRKKTAVFMHLHQEVSGSSFLWKQSGNSAA